jgi:hypothetical protein
MINDSEITITLPKSQWQRIYNLLLIDSLKLESQLADAVANRAQEQTVAPATDIRPA